MKSFLHQIIRNNKTNHVSLNISDKKKWRKKQIIPKFDAFIMKNEPIEMNYPIVVNCKQLKSFWLLFSLMRNFKINDLMIKEQNKLNDSVYFRMKFIICNNRSKSIAIGRTLNRNHVPKWISIKSWNTKTKEKCIQNRKCVSIHCIKTYPKRKSIVQTKKQRKNKFM